MPDPPEVRMTVWVRTTKEGNDYVSRGAFAGTDPDPLVRDTIADAGGRCMSEISKGHSAALAYEAGERRLPYHQRKELGG